MASESPIQGTHVTLRPIADEEMAQACAWRNDPSVAPLFYRRNVTPEQMREDVHHLRHSGSGDTLAIARRDTGAFAGTLTYTLNRKQGAPAEATLGILIGPAADRGQGLGADAIHALGLWLKSNLDVGTMLVEVKPGNERAVSFYEKIGFSQRAIILECGT